MMLLAIGLFLVTILLAKVIGPLWAVLIALALILAGRLIAARRSTG